MPPRIDRGYPKTGSVPAIGLTHITGKAREFDLVKIGLQNSHCALSGLENWQLWLF
jgi:hypothetical protein